MPVKLVHHSFESPVGFINLVADEQHLIEVYFSGALSKCDGHLPNIILDTKNQLIEYFEGKRTKFTLNFEINGTPFQKKVWEHVQKVSYGKTSSYIEIARLVGSEKYTRAVGLANGKNKLPIIIPCHRVIGSNGKLTGYSGGLERKKWLLKHELQFGGPNDKLF